MLKTFKGLDSFLNWSKAQEKQLSLSHIEPSVTAIKESVMTQGDAGICASTKAFDGVELDPHQLKVSDDDIESACLSMDSAFMGALKRAAKNIQKYHQNQLPNNWESVQDNHAYGVQYTPLDSVGIYVPGGRASYPSSVLMAAIPAKIARCPRVVMVSPPTGGQIPEAVLAAASIAGVDEVYQMGGAQSIFGLAYGTTQISPVDKIVGPGNRYVTLAKQMVYGIVDIDKPAGPSEVCVYMDQLAYAGYAAAELLAQLEHDPDASAIGFVLSDEMVDAINLALDAQINTLSRADIIRQSIQNAALVVISEEQVFEAINYCASEHLVLLSDDADNLRKKVKHAGSIFCGPYTPVALGDYYAGPNHVLPTGRSARFASPLGVMDYMKYSSYLRYSKQALADACQDLAHLTNAEGFDAHFNSVRIRVND